MASGSGKDQDDIQTQEPVQVQRVESNAAAAATAAAADPQPLAPFSERIQERDHGPPGAGGRSPTGTSAEEAAAAERKGKKVVAPTPPSSAGSSPPTPPHVVSASASGEPSSAAAVVDSGRRMRVSWRNPLVEGVVSVPKVTRHIDCKDSYKNKIDMKTVYKDMLQECETIKELDRHRPRGEAEEMERQVKPPTIWPEPEVVHKKSLWSKVKGSMTNMLLERTGRRMHYSDRNSTGMGPHVNHQTIPMTGIIEHYGLLEMVAGRGIVFDSNALNLRRAYSEFRPVLGDGECFYRSFIFSYLEQVLDRQDTHEEHRLLAAVKEVARQHARLGWNTEFSRCHKAFKKLIKKVMRWKKHRRWRLVPSANSYRKQKLLEFFSGYGTTQDIFAFLRLVAAIWICSHREEFEPLVTDLTEDYTLQHWCFLEVIQHKVFTDHVQITALVTALGVPLRVECLLQGAGQDLYTGQDSQDDTPRSTCWPRRRHLLPPGHEVPRVTVLYTDSHYDIIYPHCRGGPLPSIDESSSQESSQAQGERSTDEGSGEQSARVESPTGENSSQHNVQGRS